MKKNLNLQSTQCLPQLITHLAIAFDTVYLGGKDRLYIDRYENSNLSGDALEKWQIPLDNHISKLEINNNGCFITTKSSLYYLPLNSQTEQFDFIVKKFLPILSFPTNNLISTIEPRGNWYSTSYLPRKSKTPYWEIWQLPNCQLQKSQINRKNWNYLIATDRHHGLGIYLNKQQETEFHSFNLEGNWLNNNTIAITLDSVIFNPQFPSRLIATEKDNSTSLIVITLNTFKIQRIALNIVPQMITPCIQGYLVGDRQNNLILIEGKNLNYEIFSIPLAENTKVTGIYSNSSLLLITTSDRSKFLLHKFQLPS